MSVMRAALQIVSNPFPRLKLGRGMGLVAGILLITVLFGCADPPKPRVRPGSLPYPGLFSLYALADPQQLGEHRYEGMDALFVERSRGLVYTQRAGFLDLAHLRMTVDWTWYYYQKILSAIEAHKAPMDSARWLVLETSKPTRIHLQFSYPPGWERDTNGPNQMLKEEVAFRIAQKATWYLGIWHEMAQWYGYRSMVVISERPSAFTHDDVTAHLVGLRVVEAAWRQRRDAPFDDAVTRALEQQLEELGAVSARRTHQKIHRMRGRWWSYLWGPERRHLEHWTEQGELHPWLAANSAGGKGRWGEPMSLPPWEQAGDISLSDFVRIRIEPNIWSEQRVLTAADTRERLLCPREHFPLIKQSVQEELQDAFGPDAAQP